LLIEDLDDLPFPDRELMYSADPDLIDEGHRPFFSGRGCPYKCTYCFNEKYNDIYKSKGKVVRLRSPRNVIEEIKWVKQNHVLDVVLIDDDTFLAKPRAWFDEFCPLYKREVGLPLSCNIRPDLVTDHAIGQLRDAGLDSVWMGVECGHEEIAKKVLMRAMGNDRIVEACRVLHRHGVKIVTQNLVGLPVEDAFNVDLATLDLNIKLHPMFGWSSILFPYPGTPVRAYAQARGYLDDEHVFLETNKKSSIFAFSGPREKRKIEHLHKLFGVVVQFPSLRPLVPLLCSLPLTRLYTAIFYTWYGINMKFRLYPFRSVGKELWKYLGLWARMLRADGGQAVVGDADADATSTVPMDRLRRPLRLGARRARSRERALKRERLTTHSCS